MATQAQLDTLDAAIAKGQRRVTFGDQTIEYFSLDEMLKARGVMVASLESASGIERPRQRLGYQMGKGF